MIFEAWDWRNVYLFAVLASIKGYGLHALRHNHISQLFMRNEPPLVFSRRARHASTATTMNSYGHVISQTAKGVIASYLREIQNFWV